ncbi:MAG TPA: hypothetical protein VFW98_03860 [Gemmatimonadaceae bacterium]|nr:hypothetical protein [Gemmatimonadaceae bacterium]
MQADVSGRDPTATFHAALRHVAQRLPNVRPVLAGAGAVLERLPGDPEAPRLIAAEPVEDDGVRPHRVPGTPTTGFSAFLDGTQQSRVLAWIGAAPIVYGCVAAAVRVRAARRLVTWREPIEQRRVYAPLTYTVDAALADAFPRQTLVDTATPDAGGVIPPPHPTLLLERARLAVSRDREEIERRLAERWCRDEQRTLLIDGGIGASEAVAQAPCVVGVVKSHRTLYVDGAALQAVLALSRGERSTVIRIAPRGRSSVLSWYLRLRTHDGHDALWGLVRVEVADTERSVPLPDHARVAGRADTVSRWLLAELEPISLPDPRWDKMVYGVRNVEEYLKARV